MSTGPAAARQRTVGPGGNGARAPEDGAARFAARHLPALESRIAEAVDTATGDGVPGPAASAMAEAVGTWGRGGRRWRPLLTLAAARAAGADPAVALDVAAAVELTHAASLVLDDLPCMDDDDFRRGRPSTHRSVGSQGAVLVSVSCLALASELLGRVPEAGLGRRWGRAVGLRGMAGGQALDLTREPASLRGGERRLYRRKSTVLPAFAAWAGGRTAGADEETSAALHAYGLQLGWAYQLIDDLRDGDGAGQPGATAGPGAALRRSRRHLRLGERRLRGVTSLAPGGRILLEQVGRSITGGRLDAPAGPGPTDPSSLKHGGA